MREHQSTASRRVVADALHQYRAQLEGFVRSRVPASEVDDVLQVAAVRALERHATVQDPTRILAWLYTVHRNVMSDTVRREGSRKRLAERARLEAEAEDAPWSGAEIDELCRCSVAQAQQMGERYAEILSLVDLGDLSVAEASAVLGISANNGAVRLHRARKALRKRMLEHCGVTNMRECADCRCVDEGCCA